VNRGTLYGTFLALDGRKNGGRTPEWFITRDHDHRSSALVIWSDDCFNTLSNGFIEMRFEDSDQS